MKARDFMPAVKMGAKWYPEDMVDAGVPLDGGSIWFVDGDRTGGTGRTWESAFATVVAAEAAASAGDVIYVAAKTMAATDTDPDSYTENLTINTPQLSIIGVSRGRTQGGLPQLKVGSTTTSPIITIAAPGVLIANIGINGAGATGGGILLDDDGGSTKSSFGFTIANCHFKNCVGTTATNAATGGAIQWAATGGAWQGLITGNRFYKNVGDVVMKGTSGSVPQDIVIQDNVFSGPAASVDCNIYVAADGINGLIVDRNIFTGHPAIGFGTNAAYLKLNSCVGIMSNNVFASITEEAATEVAFGAAQTNLVPTTMFMAANYGEWSTAGAAGVGSGEIFRT